MDLTVWRKVAGLRDAASRPVKPRDGDLTQDGEPFRASVWALWYRFGKVESMTDSEPSQPGLSAQAAGDILAARLLAAQRLLCALEMDSDARLRLQLRYAAICASLKLPSADPLRGAERLDRLIADAELAGGHDAAADVCASDNAEPGAGPRDDF
jgi:hypothetical protein